MPAPRQILGSKAEDLAAEHLESKGYVILDRNWFCKVGELDIVAQDGDTLVFVEVKAFDLGIAGEDPLANVTPSKIKKLVKAARVYLARLGEEPYCRFDVVSVRLAPPASVTHYPGAFTE